MSTIVTRAGKGSALTHNEVDANFTNLNTDKLQSGNTAAALTITTATIAGGTINGTVGATTPAAGTFTDLTANNSAIISVNTSGDALRITQTGTGNALLVEDSANPDSTPLIVDADGRLVVGNTSSISGGVLANVKNIQSHSIGGAAGYTSVRWDAGANGPQLLFGKSRGGAVGTLGIVADGDILGQIYFSGDDGTDLVTPGAQIIARVDGTPGANDMPGRLEFYTTADGASVSTERMRIGSDGLVTLASTSGLSIGRTAVTSPAATDGNVFSGTYTPTLTNTTNITASTANTAYYTRVGNMVTVSGRVSIDPTATGSITLGVSLPIASDISNNCWGVCNNQQGDAIAVTSDNTNDRASFIGVVADAGNRVYSFTFQYQVV